LASVRDEVLEFLDESSMSEDRMNAAINDGVESLGQTLIKCCIEMMIAGPISITLSSGTEGIVLVSVADPTTGPTISSAVDGALSQRTAYACYALVTASGSETKPSNTSNSVISANNVAVIVSPSFVSGAIGWNCYAGTASTRMCKQN